MSETVHAQEAPVEPTEGPASGGLPAIATWPQPPTANGKLPPISRRTGEPTRVWTIWMAAVAGYLATTAVAVCVVEVYLTAILRFNRASVLTILFPTETASLGRVLLAVAVTVIAIVIGAACSITAYYAYDGRRWTRWATLIALLVSGAGLLLNGHAFFTIGFAAIMAVMAWLPPSRRYFAAWRAYRHHDPVFSPPVENVYYGPLPRFRKADP
jgi:hypothetical protein